MYLSPLRDKKVSSHMEQSQVVSSTYQESCFQQIQGQISVPRVSSCLASSNYVAV